MVINLYISDEVKKYYIENNTYYRMVNLEQFIKYILPTKYIYNISDFENANICLWNMELNDNENLIDTKINILISIENINYWAIKKQHLDWPGYIHYSKYGNYDDNKIDIYLYNHINKIDYINNSLAIPFIYIYINYFLNNKHKIKPEKNLCSSQKKFCLNINKSKLNTDINNIETLLNNIDNVDNISIYDDYIKDKSCYHSIELINILNKYKFIICFENSYDDSYITEKIFNCFYANTIPLYKGSNNITKYINNNTFIDFNNVNDNNNNLELIQKINNDDELYNNYINNEKINDYYNNENYISQYINYIEKKICC